MGYYNAIKQNNHSTMALRTIVYYKFRKSLTILLLRIVTVEPFLVVIK